MIRYSTTTAVSYYACFAPHEGALGPRAHRPGRRAANMHTPRKKCTSMGFSQVGVGGGSHSGTFSQRNSPPTISVQCPSYLQYVDRGIDRSYFVLMFLILSPIEQCILTLFELLWCELHHSQLRSSIVEQHSR